MPQNIPVSNHTLMILSSDDKALKELYEYNKFISYKKEFYKHNKIKIESLHEKMRKLQREYFVVENEKIIKENDEKDAKAKMLEGKDREEFDKKFNELIDILWIEPIHWIMGGMN